MFRTVTWGDLLLVTDNWCRFFLLFQLTSPFCIPLFESPYSDGSTGARSSEELGSAVGGEPHNRWDPADPAVINHESSTIIGTWWYDDQHDSNVGKWPTLDLGYFCILESEGKPQNSWFQGWNQSSQHLRVQISKLRQDLLIRVDPMASLWGCLERPERFLLGAASLASCQTGQRFSNTGSSKTIDEDLRLASIMAVQQRSPRSRHGCCWILCSQRLQVFLLIWRICL